QEKESEMALPKLVGKDGREAVLAFTGTDPLRRWRADARPIQATALQICEAATQEKAAAVVIDVAGPIPFVIEGEVLRALAAIKSGTLDGLTVARPEPATTRPWFSRKTSRSRPRSRTPRSPHREKPSAGDLPTRGLATPRSCHPEVLPPRGTVAGDLPRKGDDEQTPSHAGKPHARDPLVGMPNPLLREMRRARLGQGAGVGRAARQVGSCRTRVLRCAARGWA